MKKILLIALTILIVLPITADAGNRNRQRISSECSLLGILKELPEEFLDAAETPDLLFMYQEEKLARDVYLSLYERWEVKAFKKISRQEKTHMKAVRTLLRKYDLDDQAGPTAIGAFLNSSLQDLYDSLTDMGDSSLASAFTVGVLIEELDISDLQGAFARTNNQDTRTLYQNLMKESRNHLRTFAALLAGEGGSYTPDYLLQTEYDEIVNSPKEKGGVLDATGEYVCGTTRNRSGGN